MWTGACWQEERTRRAFRWAHELARQRANDGGGDKAIVQAGRAAFAAGVERIAQSDPTLAVTSEVWDADPWLLGTPSGTIDLRTGDIRTASHKKDFITKQTAVATSRHARLSAMGIRVPSSDATANDAGSDPVSASVVRIHASPATPEGEHALPVHLWAKAGTAKSSLPEHRGADHSTEYGKVAAMETFVASSSDKRPPDLAMLKGARMVSASETEDGRAMGRKRASNSSPAVIPISARFMKQDFFTFVPESLSWWSSATTSRRYATSTRQPGAELRFCPVPSTNLLRPDRQLEDEAPGRVAGNLAMDDRGVP